MLIRLIAVTALVLSAACGSPNDPTVVPEESVTGPFRVYGSITEPQAGFAQGIYGATIELVRGTGIGLRMTTTDYLGRYELNGLAGDVQLKVTADGYETRLVNLTVSRSEYVRIYLSPLEGSPGTLSGKWMLTIVAPDCLFLPEAARTRQFLAEFSHTGSSRLGAKLSSQSVTHTDLLIGQAVGDTIVLPLPYWPGDIMDYPYYALVDSLQPKGSLGFRGMIRATVDGPSASGVLDGTIDYYPDTVITDGASMCLGPAAVTLKRGGQ